MHENPSPQGHLRVCRWIDVVLAGHVGVLVIAGALAASCVNLSYPPGASRDGGVFVSHLSSGAACAKGGDCQSGLCVDLVCCTTACEGPCMTCAKSGSEGFCMPADVGTNPRGACLDLGAAKCGRNGTCDGAGACDNYPAGTICKDATCGLDGAVLASRCNMGMCEPGGVKDCSPYVCGSAGDCLTECSEPKHCVNPNPCVAGLCGKKALGTACGAGVECDSGFCAQNVCCATDCAGGCLSCAVKGSEGACKPVTAGTAGFPSTFCAMSDVGMCKTDGTCDGAGACRLYPAGTTCSPASCSTATLRSAGTCDGKGSCQVPAAVTCGGYTCASTTACRTMCAADPDCASPSVCGLPQMACGGLSAQYFRQTNLTDLAFSRTDAQINFDWMGFSPSPQLNVDNFAIRWHGKITARFSEMYTFFAGTDDGERLWIGGKLIIDRYIRHASVPEDVSGQVPLSKGVAVDIQMEYFENGGDANVRLSWQSASEPKAVIPTSALAPQ
jgi:hypothetical protein